jgi:hypothetical protein
MRMVNRTTAADGLQRRLRPRGAADPEDLEQARRLFDQAEELQKERQPKYLWLYSLPGFRHCDPDRSSVRWSRWRCTVCGWVRGVTADAVAHGGAGGGGGEGRVRTGDFNPQ